MRDEFDRFCFEPAYDTPACNTCIHSFGLNCKAYPEGIPIEVLNLKIEQKKKPELLKESCNNTQYCFESK